MFFMNTFQALTSLPSGHLIESKWVYKINITLQGLIGSRASLKEKALTMRKSFALIAKLTTIQCLLLIVVARNWSLHQMDIQNTSPW